MELLTQTPIKDVLFISAMIFCCVMAFIIECKSDGTTLVSIEMAMGAVTLGTLYFIIEIVSDPSSESIIKPIIYVLVLFSCNMCLLISKMVERIKLKHKRD